MNTIIEIFPGDFLKNAGIVGMKYMLDLSSAKESIDYGITEDSQALWLSQEFAVNADWTDMYFKVLVKWFGPSTIYKTVLDKIKINCEKLSNGVWKPEKTEKDDLKFINDKLLSNSYKTGFDNIKNNIEYSYVYEQLKSNKLKNNTDPQELLERLKQLDAFLRQPLCEETFCMKSIIYNYINRFWEGKSFLLRANAKKDMHKSFEEDFSVPFREYFKKDHSKSKENCIECNAPVDSTEKVSIAFMNDKLDDATRKRSAFWNFEVDSFLCPLCTFIYALSPLGFQLIGNKFLFINANSSISMLISSNDKRSKIMMESEKDDNEKYPSWFAKVMNVVLYQKTKELSNINVILKGTNENDSYLFTIIGNQVLRIINQGKVKEHLITLSEHPIVKIKNEFLNVYETVVINLVQYRNQYSLLNRLLKESVETDYFVFISYLVFYIQVQTDIVKNDDEKRGKIIMNRTFAMRNSGYALRKALLTNNGVETDDFLRGTMYQLLNALSTRNVEKFIEITMRIYCSIKLTMPDGFLQMLDDPKLFQKYGYAFMMGLKGSYPEYKENNSEKDKTIDE